jgi:hypothetical protein
MLLFTFLINSVATAPFTVGYLQDSRFEMQNMYMVNYFGRLERSGLVTRKTNEVLDLESLHFRTVEELQDCI